MTKFSSTMRQPSPTQTVAKKHLKTHLKRIRNREYCRLRDMVPAIANKQKVSKVTVIEEAVRYIDELHLALASRLTNNKDLFVSSDCDKEDKLKQLIHSFIPANFYERKPPTIDFEKQQRLPTYLTENNVKKPSKISHSDFEFHFIWTVLRNHGATAARTRDQRMVKKDGMETVSGYTLYHNVCLRTYQLVLFIDDDDNIVRIVFVMI